VRLSFGTRAGRGGRAPPHLHPGQQEGALARRRDLQGLLELLHEVVHVEVLVRRHDVLPRARARHGAREPDAEPGRAAQVPGSSGPERVVVRQRAPVSGLSLKSILRLQLGHTCCFVRQHPAPPDMRRSAPRPTGRGPPLQPAVEREAAGAGRAPSSARPGRSWPGARPGRGPPPAGTARRTWP
jgi:hypothetical protein